MGIGTQEILLLLFFALIFFGANKIPGIARGLGKGIAEFRRAARDIQDEINRSMDEEPERKRQRKELPDSGPEQTAEGPPPSQETGGPSESDRPAGGEGEEEDARQTGEHPDEA